MSAHQASSSNVPEFFSFVSLLAVADANEPSFEDLSESEIERALRPLDREAEGPKSEIRELRRA